MKYQTLFTPIQIGKLTLKNRFAMAPMGPLGLGDSEGGWNQRGIDYYTCLLYTSRRLGREHGSDQHETASYTGAGQSDAWKIRIPERRNPQARAGTSP